MNVIRESFSAITERESRRKLGEVDSHLMNSDESRASRDDRREAIFREDADRNRFVPARGEVTLRPIGRIMRFVSCTIFSSRRRYPQRGTERPGFVEVCSRWRLHQTDQNFRFVLHPRFFFFGCRSGLATILLLDFIWIQVPFIWGEHPIDARLGFRLISRVDK